LEDTKEVDLDINDEKSENVRASWPDAEQNCTVEAGENPFEISKTCIWEIVTYKYTIHVGIMNRIDLKKSYYSFLLQNLLSFLFQKSKCSFLSAVSCGRSNCCFTPRQKNALMAIFSVSTTVHIHC
jgi:hypothetical protein